MNPAGDLRFALRTLGFVGLTGSLLVALETDTALKPSSERDQVLYKWMQTYGVGLLDLAGVEIVPRGPFVSHRERYPGTDARGLGRVFVMNHRSLIDIFVTLAFVEATIVSRADLADWPVIGYAARRVGTLFVERSNKKSGAAVVATMVRALERGRAVMIYPEGFTFAGDEVRPFKAGAFLAAHKTGAEIVPIGLAYEGDASAYLDEPFTTHMRRVAGEKKTRAAIEVGAPIASEGKDVTTLLNEAHAAVQALVLKARATLEDP